MVQGSIVVLFEAVKRRVLAALTSARSTVPSLSRSSIARALFGADDAAGRRPSTDDHVKNIFLGKRRRKSDAGASSLATRVFSLRGG